MASTESELVFEKIKEILKKYGFRRKLTLETNFRRLGIVGLELDDFFSTYVKTFNVDMTGYKYCNFFYEDSHPLFILRDTFYRIFNPEKVRIKKLTLGHLANVAEAGKWFDPE